MDFADIFVIARSIATTQSHAWGRKLLRYARNDGSDVDYSLAQESLTVSDL